MRKFLWLLTSLPLYFSCSTPRYVYAPARVNAPLLEEKNEVQLDGSLSALNGFDASGAFAFSQHVGLMLNGSWMNDHQEGSVFSGELLPPQRIDYHRTSVDLGLGWFACIDSTKWHFEIYAGMGTGKFSMRDVGSINTSSGNISYSRDYDSRLERIFAQPAFGLNSSKNLQLVFFARLLFQKYQDVETNYSSNEMTYYLIPQDPGKYFAFLEPGFSFRFYFTSMPILGFETNFMLSRSFNSNYLNTIPVQASIGVHLRFQKRLPK